MKKLLVLLLSFCCALCLAFPSVGCSGSPKEYTIQYSDDAGTHSLTVTKGGLYTLESVPYKYGYDFLGLFDAETGGTQYVDANGAAIAPYPDKTSKVLYPHFKPIDYTVILDYGEATVTGERSLTVAYNANLPDLPKNLTLEHNVFTGWYTEAGGKGTRVADAYGNLPVVSVLNEENFKLDDSKRVYLYAGFELEKYTVTFIFDNDMPSEEVEVPYNTPISQVVPKTRNSEKKAGLTWSKSRDGDIFNDNVTDNIVLYVKEWAPVIELNGNGADVTPIVARAGSTISLPTPTKPLAKFLRWEDEKGQTSNITKMPAEGASLNAVWQAKIEFDENGGTDVDDISKPAGESISLPTPTKEGYFFAGWYTANKEQYTQTRMPSAGIALKAGWYKAKEAKKDFLSGDNTSSTIWSKTPWLRSSYDIDFTETISEIDWNKPVNVRIVFHADIRHYTEESSELPLYATKEHFYYYSQPVVNDAYLLSHIIVDHANGSVNSSFVTTTFETSLTVEGGKIYAALASDKDSEYIRWLNHYYCGWDMKNFWAEIEYPDTTYLYL